MSIIRPSTIEELSKVYFIDPGTAAVISTGIGIVGTKLAGDAAGDAAADAAQAQKEASESAAQIQLQMYEQARADTAPYRAAGINALNTLTGGNQATGQPYDATSTLTTGTGYTSPPGINSGLVMEALRRMESGDMFIDKANQLWEKEALKLYNMGIKSTDLQTETVNNDVRLTTNVPAASAQNVMNQSPTGQPWTRPENFDAAGHYLGDPNDPNLPPEYQKDSINYTLHPEMQGTGTVAPPADTQPPPAPTPDGGLLAGPGDYAGPDPTNILNQGFQTNVPSPGQYLEQNPYVEPEFNYSGTTTPAQLAERGFQYSGPDPTRSMQNFLNYQPEEFAFEKDPGYQFRLREGEQAIERAQSARGNVLSGSAGKELLRYGQGYASKEFGAAHDRYKWEQNRDMELLRQKYLTNAADYDQERASFMDRYNMTAQAFGQEFGQYMQNRQQGYNEYLGGYEMNRGAYNTDYGQYVDKFNLATTDKGNWYNRYADKVNRYMNLATMGANTAVGAGSQAINTGTNLANTYLGEGNAAAAGHLNQGNVDAATITGVANALNTGIGNILAYNAQQPLTMNNPNYNYLNTNTLNVPVGSSDTRGTTPFNYTPGFM